MSCWRFWCVWSSGSRTFVGMEKQRSPSSASIRSDSSLKRCKRTCCSSRLHSRARHRSGSSAPSGSALLSCLTHTCSTTSSVSRRPSWKALNIRNMQVCGVKPKNCVSYSFKSDRETLSASSSTSPRPSIFFSSKISRFSLNRLCFAFSSSSGFFWRLANNKMTRYRHQAVCSMYI